MFIAPEGVGVKPESCTFVLLYLRVDISVYIHVLLFVHAYTPMRTHLVHALHSIGLMQRCTPVIQSIGGSQVRSRRVCACALCGEAKETEKGLQRFLMIKSLLLGGAWEMGRVYVVMMACRLSPFPPLMPVWR